MPNGQNYLVLAIAIVGACIAFLQWKLARDRLTLDLFQQRMKIFNSINDILSEIILHGMQVVNDKTRTDFSRASSEVQFLFGTDVVAMVEKVSIALRSGTKKEGQQEQDLDTIEHFLMKFPPIMCKYVRMNHKRFDCSPGRSAWR